MARHFGSGRKRNYDDVLAYIIDYKRQNDGASPTVREIAKHLGIKSTGYTRHILNCLEAEGKIILGYAEFRNIRIPGGRWDLTEKP